MKKIITFGSIFSILIIYSLLLTPVKASAAASLSLSPSTGTINKGCPVTIDVNVNTGGAATDGTDVILFYDPTRIKAEKINNGTIYADYPGNSIDAQNGKITVSGISSVSSPFTGSGILASIDFTVLSDAPSEVTKVTFDFDPQDKAKTIDSNVVQRSTTVNDILGQVTDGTYTISDGACGSFSPTIVVTNPAQGDPDLIYKTPVPKTLPASADITPTVIFAAAGGMLVIFGLLGLALL